MKKILSVLLAVAMLVGMIVPSLTVAAAGDALVVAASDADFVAGGATEFTSKVSITDNPGDLVYFQLLVWWETASGVADFDVVYDGNLFSSNSGITAGPLAGNNRNMKANAGAFGVATADYQCAVVDFEVEADAIDAAEMDLVDLVFGFDEAPAAGDSFTYGVGVLYACDSNDDDLVWDEEGCEATLSFTADAVYEALAAEYAGQALTIVATDVTIDAASENRIVEVPVYMLNNDEDDSDATETANIGVWGVANVIVYDKALTMTGPAVNGYVFWDQTAINTGDIGLDYTSGKQNTNDTMKYAFSSFNFVPENNPDKCWTTVVFMPESPSDQFYGNGLLYTVSFQIPDNARPGTVYDIMIMSDLDDGVSNAKNFSVPFQCVDGSITITGEALPCDHVNTHEVITLNPTCTETGLKNIVCDDCEEIVEADVEIAALGHTEVEIPAVTATCTTAGATAGIKCSVCDEVLVAPEEISALGHDADNATWEVITPAGIGVAGEEGLKCPVCGEYIETREIPALTQAIITAGSSEVLEGADVEVPVSVENNNGIWAIGATLTDDGLTYVGVESGLFTIGEDNVSYADGVVTIFVDNADLVDIAEDGVLFTVLYTAPREAGEYNVDLEVFDIIDADGADVDFEAADAVVTVDACNHEFAPVVVTPATATSEGLLQYVCTICGAIESEEVIPMLTSIVVGEAEGSKGATVSVPVTLANNNGVWSIGMTIGYDEDALEFAGLEGGLFAVDESSASAADGVVTIFVMADGLENVTEDGVAFYANFEILTAEEGEYALAAAIIADNTITDEAEEAVVIPFDGKVTVTACAHENTELQGAVAATCVETGFTGDLVCLDCGEIVEAGEIIAIDPANHEGEEIEGTPAITATCATEGFTASTVCSACGETLVAAESLGFDADNHEGEEIEGTPAITATCVTEGFTASTVCSACGETIAEAESLGFDADNHEGPFEWVVVSEATTAVTGLEEYQCSACGAATDEREIPVIPVETFKFLTGASAKEKVRSVSLDGNTITIYAQNLAEYVKIAVLKDSASKVKITGFTGCTIAQSANYTFSYITIENPTTGATITCRNAAGEEEVYNIVVVYSTEGVQAGGKMNGITLNGTDITVYAPADADSAAFRYVFEDTKHTFVTIPEDVDTVKSGSITWFKIYNDGTNNVVKEITVQDGKGLQTTYTITAVFGN